MAAVAFFSLFEIFGFVISFNVDCLTIFLEIGGRLLREDLRLPPDSFFLLGLSSMLVARAVWIVVVGGTSVVTITSPSLVSAIFSFVCSFVCSLSYLSDVHCCCLVIA